MCSFWCAKIAPGQVCRINLPESTELKLTNACIIPQTPPIPTNGVSLSSNPMFQPPLSIIRLCIENNTGFNRNNNIITLGTFVPGKVEHQTMNFIIKSDQFTYTCLQNISTGTGEIIHVCGTLTEINTKSDFDEYEYEDNSNQDKDENNNDDLENHDLNDGFGEPGGIDAFIL